MATITAIYPAGGMANFAAVIAALALAMGIAVLFAARQFVRETTLTSAWGWAVAALVLWSAVEVAAGFGWLHDEGWLVPLRLAAVALSFCPVISLIGAKRPQHAAWNFIVISLWGIVVLPAAETFLLQRGQQLEMGDARGWFLWILIVLTPINFVPTRFWLPGLLLAAGQTIALGVYLPLLRRELIAETSAAGLALASIALVVAWLVSRRMRVGSNAYDRLWLDFRDRFGLLWSLRVQERVNALAKQENWPLELAWRGFCDSETGAPLAAIDDAIEPTLRTSLKGLLRRFVSSEWIAERLPANLD